MNDKRKYISSTSELDTSANASETSVVEAKTKIKKKSKAKKQKMANETKEELKCLTKSIEEINKKLNNILTKDDKAIIREIIYETIEQMKGKLLGSIIKRLDSIEGEMHERAIENQNLKKEIADMTKENKKLQEERSKAETELNKEKDLREKSINELEQYGRRNNVRITGIADNEYETAEMTTNKVVNFINEKLPLTVTESDIDISHRMGKFDISKKRPIIVKFTRRHIQNALLRNSKELKGSGVYINEDLTKLNAKVLTAMRIKDKELVTRVWSYQGKLFLKNKTDETVEVKYEKFSYWLKKDWPKDESAPEMET